MPRAAMSVELSRKNMAHKSSAERKYTVLSNFGTIYFLYFIRALVAQRQNFFVEQMAVNLPLLRELEDSLKMQKTMKNFSKKYPGIAEMLESDSIQSAVIDKNTAQALQKYAKEVENLLQDLLYKSF